MNVFEEPNKDFYSNHWLTVIEIDENKTGGISREDLRKYMESENIECRPLWKPMHMQPVFHGYPFYGTGIAEEMFKNGLCLPSGSNLSDEDRDRIAKAILNRLEKIE